MGFTTSTAKAILASAFSSGKYIGLSLSAPSSDGSGFVEPSSSTGYKRSKIGEMKFTGRTISNKETIFFNESVEDGGGYGTITHFLVFDVETGGTPTFTGELTEPITIGEGYIPIFRAEKISITLE